jgi:hypothetical protein
MLRKFIKLPIYINNLSKKQSQKYEAADMQRSAWTTAVTPCSSVREIEALNSMQREVLRLSSLVSLSIQPPSRAVPDFAPTVHLLPLPRLFVSRWFLKPYRQRYITSCQAKMKKRAWIKIP